MLLNFVKRRRKIQLLPNRSSWSTSDREGKVEDHDYNGHHGHVDHDDHGCQDDHRHCLRVCQAARDPTQP